jgi:hypothetical protein
MQRGGLAVDTDVRHSSAGPYQAGTQFERLGDADRLDGHVRTESVGELLDDATGSSVPLLITTSAPNCLAASSRLGARSMATTWLGVNSFAPRIAASPIGPAPTMATVSAGRTAPLSTPTS